MPEYEPSADAVCIPDKKNNNLTTKSDLRPARCFRLNWGFELYGPIALRFHEMQIWNTSWLQGFFLLGTENWEGQLKQHAE